MTRRDKLTRAECLNRQYFNICLAKKPNVKIRIRNSLLCKKNNIGNKSLHHTIIDTIKASVITVGILNGQILKD
jgi:hypothetical protein